MIDFPRDVVAKYVRYSKLLSQEQINWWQQIKCQSLMLTLSGISLQSVP